MPHEVKMPQLGMTQDSGVIVTWLKAAGDEVTQGDALFEVETDKATMEVEAQAGGWLTGVQAGEGDDVPVGDVIALIVENEDDVSEHAATQKAEVKPPVQTQGNDAEEAETIAAAPAAPAPAPEPVLCAAPISATGKVLASPKAKRLALERGIDLAALRAKGVSEPIHAADLSRATAGGQAILTAGVSGTALNALLASSDESNRSELFASFAAGAWRTLFDVEAGVAYRSLDGTTTKIKGERATLTLVDLCETRLTGYAPASGSTTLTAARDGDGYAFTLSFHEGTLPLAQAAALLDDFAARVEDPIRQLL